MMTNKMKLKQLQNILHVIVNANAIVQHIIEIKKWNNKACQCECKNYRKCKKDYSWNPSTHICENSKYLKNIADISVTECDKIIIAMDIVSTKKATTIATNVTSTASINYHDKKVRDFYILHTVLLVIIILLTIIIICYYYAKQKGINVQTI